MRRMFENRGPWLGQVPLVMRPSLGTKPTPAWQKEPPGDATPPEGVVGCVYVGSRAPWSGSVVDANIKQAQANGYTDIHELGVPPCDPTRDPLHCEAPNPWISENPRPYKYVWACLPKGAISAPRPLETPTAVPTAESTTSAPSPFPTSTVLAVGGGLTAAGVIAFLALR